MENKELEDKREAYAKTLKKEVERLRIESEYWGLVKDIEESKYMINEFRVKGAMLAAKYSKQEEAGDEVTEE
jgi:hypothetical protein